MKDWTEGTDGVGTAAWKAIADAASPGGRPPDPARVVRAALTRSAIDGSAGRPRDRHPARRLGALVVAEARLIRPAVPIASAMVMALGVGTVLLQASAGANLVLALVAPIVAAAGVAGTYRSRRDPALEMVAATPTSGRLLLLVRIAVVFGLDLVLAVSASAALTAAGATGAAGMNALVGAWLGPMALLSALGLLVAVRFGPDVALGVAVGLWAVRVLVGGALIRDGWPARFIVAAWSTNATVLIVSAAVAAGAVAMAGRGEPRDGWRATHSM
jgi:hypothetical protein